MSKRQVSKYKINRRLGVNLWGRSKSPVVRRDYGPGQHGQKRRKPTDFGLQLMAKQKLRGYYGNIGERQFRRIYAEAVRRRGDSSENLIGLLESRLDAVVYRAKFAPTVFAARQLVNHRHVCVNGRRVKIPSCRLKPGDVIEMQTRARSMVLVLGAMQSAERDVPDYITVDEKAMKAVYVQVPKLADVPYPATMEPSQVIEFYSR